MVGMGRRALTLAIAAAVLAGAVVGGSSILVWQRVRPRLPALATATPTLDQAIAAVVAAAGDDAAVAVTGLVPSKSCNKTPLAKGNVYTRTADLYADAGHEDSLIARIAVGLPASEHPQLESHVPGGGSSLTADVGGGIHLQVLPVSPGWLAATATTDCRTGGQAQPVAGGDPALETGPITQLLGDLGATPAGFHSDAVACSSGRIITLDAISQPTDTANLRARLSRYLPAGARLFGSASNRAAWRMLKVSTIVASSDDGTQITVQRTVSC
jgi:hypothetical protein